MFDMRSIEMAIYSELYYAANDAADDVKPISKDFLDDGSAVKHCCYDKVMRLKCGCSLKIERKYKEYPLLRRRVPYIKRTRLKLFEEDFDL